MEQKTHLNGDPVEFVLISIGRGGVTWYKRGRETEHGTTKGKIKGYDREEARQYANEFGITLIDTTKAPDENLSELAISGPLLAQMPKDVDWNKLDNPGSLTRVTPKMFMEHAEEYGAEIVNREEITEFESEY